MLIPQSCFMCRELKERFIHADISVISSRYARGFPPGSNSSVFKGTFSSAVVSGTLLDGYGLLEPAGAINPVT